ncbi:MAG: CHAT domain-containing protein [Bacteroidia bacterium]|nr:CHAT domain-containing protein [Bacteroidia bacterium]
MKAIMILFFCLLILSINTKNIIARNIYSNNEKKVNSLIEQGNIRLSVFEIDSALFYFTEALVISKQNKLSKKELSIHLIISNCYTSIKEFNKAKDELNYSLIILNSINVKNELKSDYFFSLGYYNYCKGDFVEAEIAYKKALFYKKDNDFSIILELERSCLKQNKLKDASIYLNKIDLISDSLWLIYSMSFDYALLEIAQLNFKNNICNNDINILPFLSILEKKDTFSSNKARAYHYQCLGLVYRYLEDYSKSLKYLKIAYDECNAINDDTKYLSLISLSHNLLNIYSKISDFSKAEMFYNKILLYKKRLRSSNNIDDFELFCSVGVNYFLKKDYLESIKFLDSALVYSKNITPDAKANLYDYYALAYSALGEYSKSNEHFKKALFFRQKQNPINIHNLSKDYQNYSELLMKMGRSKEAIAMGKKSCKLIQQVMGQKSSSSSIALTSIANIYLDSKDYNNALINFDKALLAASSESLISEKKLFPKSASVVYPVAYLKALKGKASALFVMSKGKEAQLEKSLLCYNEAIYLLEKIRSANQFDEDKLLLTENENSIYNSAVQVAYELYKISGKDEYLNTAFNISERNKATVLREKVSLLNKFPEGSQQYSLYQKDQKLRKEISSLERKIPMSNSIEASKLKEQLYKLYDDQEAFFTMLKDKYPKLYDSWISSECMSIAAVQKKLLNTESLVEYILADSTLYTIIISKTGKDFIKTVLPGNFKENMYKYIDEISCAGADATTIKGFNSFIQNSYSLYSVILKPVKNLIKKNSLIIVSDGVLNLLPFETLLTNNYNNSHVDYRYLPYLIKERSVSYANSATLYCSSGKTDNKTPKNILAFAPGYTSSNSAIAEVVTRSFYSPLRGAKEEVNSFNGILNGDYFFNNEATETEFKNRANDYSIIHMAMHGQADADDSGNSRLIFENGGKGNDGFLYAWEIYNMNLNPDMVVLSACNTGTGKLRKGEGVMSLARSFSYAGCPSVVMTLWSISDLSSTDLMKYFYSNLSLGDNKAEALQKAKTEYITQTSPMKSHPYYWAGYVVIGDKSPVEIDSHINKMFYTSSVSLAILALAFVFVRRRFK